MLASMRWFVACGICVCSIGCGSGGAEESSGAPEEDEDTEAAACRDFRQLGVLEACRALYPSSCPSTLTALLESNDVPEDPFASPNLKYARTGCGLTEVSFVHRVVGGPRYVFGSEGELVGFLFNSDSAWGPCHTASYEAGASMRECSPERTCWLASDALETGELCACACPDVSATEVSAPPECVFAPPDGRACLETMDEMYESLSEGVVRAGCGVTVFSFESGPDTTECWYDFGRVIGGARHLAVPECGGIETWTTGGPYVSCAEEQSCYFGAGEAPAGVPRCP